MRDPMSIGINEAGFENAIIDLLKELGYQYYHGPDVDRDYSVPYFETELEESISRLNSSLPREAIENAFQKLKNFDNGELVQQNETFMDYL